MAPFDYLPGSVSTPTFTKRQDPDGIYDCLVNTFSSMGSSAIANADVNNTFFRYIPNGLKSDCQYYHDSECAEYSGNLFGEILGQAHGTFVGARGNHYPGPNASKPNQITDNTKTRCSIVLGCPSFAPVHLKDIWHNQLCTFIDIYKSEADSVNMANVKEIVKPISPGQDADAITLTGGLMYTIPKRKNLLKERVSSDSQPAVARSFKKRPLTGQDMQTARIDSNLGTRHNDVSKGVQPDPPVWPSDREIYPGAEYDHRLMPDFGGQLFALNRAKLVQPDWRDVNGNLITPWSNHTSLRPGTLVVANISIRTFIVRSNNSRNPDRKVYQALINHLQVVAESDIQVGIPTPLAVNVVHGHSSVVLGHNSGSIAFNDLKATFASRMGAMGGCSPTDSDVTSQGRNKKPRSDTIV
ncbi:hypothetical protein EV368DRAFT_66849 [Lentinula lateritia]|nr:hypothetical protein EV368DRAFT_66849 [Lentinula lateritia]